MMKIENVINNTYVIPATIRSYNGFIIENSSELKYSLELITTLEVFGYHCYYIKENNDAIKLSFVKPEDVHESSGWFFTKSKMIFRKNSPDEFIINERNAKYYVYINGALEIILDIFNAKKYGEKMSLNDYCNKYEEIIFNDTTDCNIDDMELPDISFESLAFQRYMVIARMYNCKGGIIEDTGNKENMILVKEFKNRGFNIYYLKHSPRRDINIPKYPESIWNEPVNSNMFGWFITKNTLLFKKGTKSKILTDNDAVYYAFEVYEYDEYGSYYWAKELTYMGITVDEFLCYNTFYDKNIKLKTMKDSIICKGMSFNDQAGIVIKADKDIKKRSLQYLLMRNLFKHEFSWYTLKYKNDKRDTPFSIIDLPYGENIFGWFLAFYDIPEEFDENICTGDEERGNFEFKLSDENTKVYMLNEKGEVESLPFSKYDICKSYPISTIMLKI